MRDSHENSPGNPLRRLRCQGRRAVTTVRINAELNHRNLNFARDNEAIRPRVARGAPWLLQRAIAFSFVSGRRPGRHDLLLRNNEGSFAKAALSFAKVLCWRHQINRLCERQPPRFARGRLRSRKGGAVSSSNYGAARATEGLAMTTWPRMQTILRSR